MQLFASTSQAASHIVAVLGSAGFKASFEPRAGAYPVSVTVAQGREAEVLDLAKAEAVQTR